MQAHEHVLCGGVGNCFFESPQFGVFDVSACMIAHAAVYSDHKPMVAPQRATVLKGRCRQCSTHQFTHVMIAGHAKNGQAERFNQVAKPVIGGAAVVLNHVAGHGDKISRPVRSREMRQNIAQRRMRHRAAQTPARLCEQVRVCDMQYPNRCGRCLNNVGSLC